MQIEKGGDYRASEPFEFTELQEKWLTALESGEYTQARGMLRDSEDNFCCLGVMCDIVQPDHWVKTTVKQEWYECDFVWYYRDVMEENIVHNMDVPSSIRQKIRFRSPSGHFFPNFIAPQDPDFDRILQEGTTRVEQGERLTSLANLNDRGWTFKEIAGLVRRNPRVFFLSGDEEPDPYFPPKNC